MSHLIGRAVSVRNHIDHHGLQGMFVTDDDYRVIGAGKYVPGKIVFAQSCWRGPGHGWVRLEYPGHLFKDGAPRYGNTAMRHLRAP